MQTPLCPFKQTQLFTICTNTFWERDRGCMEGSGGRGALDASISLCINPWTWTTISSVLKIHKLSTDLWVVSPLQFWYGRAGNLAGPLRPCTSSPLSLQVQTSSSAWKSLSLPNESVKSQSTTPLSTPLLQLLSASPLHPLPCFKLDFEEWFGFLSCVMWLSNNSRERQWKYSSKKAGVTAGLFFSTGDSMRAI